MTNDKPHQCKILFCGNTICQECPDGELCALHVMVKKTGGKLLYQEGFAKL